MEFTPPMRRVIERHGRIDFQAAAEAIGLSRQTVSATLRGTRRNGDVQDLLADYFEISAPELFGALYEGQRTVGGRTDTRRLLSRTGAGVRDGARPVSFVKR